MIRAISNPSRIYSIPEGVESYLAFPNLLRDRATLRKDTLLERYFYDLYSLFLNNMTLLAMGEKDPKKESKKLHAMLDEILKVKALLEVEDRP